jgi:hypothetical protein
MDSTVFSGIANRPPFQWLSGSSLILNTGIEPSCTRHLLPMPMELNGDAR